jgi:hypothetical protein
MRSCNGPAGAHPGQEPVEHIQREPDDGGWVALDPADQGAAAVLKGITAGAEKGTDGRDMTAEPFRWPGPQRDAGEGGSLTPPGTSGGSLGHQAKSRHDHVRLSPETFEHRHRLGGIRRFPQTAAAMNDDGVGRQNERPGMPAECGVRLQPGQPKGVRAWGFAPAGRGFRAMGGRLSERESRGSQQFRPRGGGGCQNQSGTGRTPERRIHWLGRSGGMAGPYHLAGAFVNRDRTRS